MRGAEMTTGLHFASDAARKFRTAVSLHSHTLHSRETLACLYTFARQSRAGRTALQYFERRFREAHGVKLDLNRGWWTPPLSAQAAWLLEKQNIQDRFGLSALVSLSDHDDIEAPMSLRVLSQSRAIPISLEWTVPFENTFFHLGIHNIPVERARAAAVEFSAYTDAPTPERLGELMEWTALPHETLVVFNHPFLDESGIGDTAHEAAIKSFAAKYGRFVHAVEINGMRPWQENKRAIEFAKFIGRPAISGGDRHGMEANTILNLTNSATFSGFAEEIRSGQSNVLVTEQYREPFAMRILQNVEEMTRNLDDHGLGWSRWCDRVFYQFEDGRVRSLTELFGNQVPRPAAMLFRAIELFRSPHVRRVIRLTPLGQQPSLM
jgi:hypothetical protein